MRKSQLTFTPQLPPIGAEPQLPKKPYLAAVHRLSSKVAIQTPTFDSKGYLRTIAADSPAGLFPNAGFTTPELHAHAFLQSPEIQNGLGLRHVGLSEPTVLEIPNIGWRVSYSQHVEFDGEQVPVLHGHVDVAIGKDGPVFNLNSTLRHGSRDTSLTRDKLIAEAKAIAIASRHVKFDAVDKARAELFFSEHNRKMSPVWKVVLTQLEPRRVVSVLVKATTGRIVGKPYDLVHHVRFRKGKRRAQPVGKAPETVLEAIRQAFATDFGFIREARRGRRSRTRTTSARTGNIEVAAKALLTVPDPNVDIAKQLYDVIIESLPDPAVLKNDNFTLYVNNRHDPVKAKADGTFNYQPNDPEFSAVVTFFVLNIQWELMKKWGLPTGRKMIPVRVESRSASDNAFFDPENWEIHIGIGSGTRAGGLSRYIAYDISVALHENGHHLVFELAPANDLPGAEGAAIHEAVGDVQGSILVGWWLKVKFAKVMNITVTEADIEKDERKVGTYAAPPDGIRQQKNKAKPPLSGEPHDDSLIVGGAMADLLVAMVKAHKVEPGLEMFGRLTNLALTLVPSHKVTFKDLLNAYRTADQQNNKKVNDQAIIDAFADHGIKLSSSRGRRGGGSPVIIID